MKIFLPFSPRAIGGTSVFARKFKKAMEENNHQVTFTHCKDYDMLFIIVDCPLKYVIEAKIKQKKIIQRLDGSYYPSVSGSKYKLLNLKAKIIHNYFADHLIYQSKYSKYSSNKFLGKTKKPYSIVYNGVDTELFSRKGSTISTKKKGEKFSIVTSSRFRRPDQIEPIIEALKELRKKRKDFSCSILGSFTQEVEHFQKTNESYIRFLGKINNEDLPKYYRGADMFIMSHLNPPCPNNIIEALSCGLPICGIDDGAMSELVNNHKNGELLSTKGDAYFKMREYDAKAFARQIDGMLNNIEKYKREASSLKEDFYIEAMIANYIEVFRSLQ